MDTKQMRRGAASQGMVVSKASEAMFSTDPLDVGRGPRRQRPVALRRGLLFGLCLGCLSTALQQCPLCVPLNKAHTHMRPVHVGVGAVLSVR